MVSCHSAILLKQLSLSLAIFFINIGNTVPELAHQVCIGASQSFVMTHGQNSPHNHSTVIAERCPANTAKRQLAVTMLNYSSEFWELIVFSSFEYTLTRQEFARVMVMETGETGSR